MGERAVRGEEAHIEAGVRLGLPEKVAWSKDVREADRLCTASQGAAGQAQTGLRSTVEGAGAGTGPTGPAGSCADSAFSSVCNGGHWRVLSRGVI